MLSHFVFEAKPEDLNNIHTLQFHLNENDMKNLFLIFLSIGFSIGTINAQNILISVDMEGVAGAVTG